MKLVDIGVSKSPAGNGVRVRVPPAAQKDFSFLSYIVGVALGDGNLSNPNGRALRLRITCDEKYPGIANEMVHFTNVCKELADDCERMMLNLGFKPKKYFISSLGRHKYVVRLSKNVQEFIQSINLTKD